MLAPDKDLITRQFLDESNKIEGVYDSDSLYQALNAWDYLINQNTLSKEVILETHRILMLNHNLEKRYKGMYRDCEVMIAGRLGYPHKTLDRQMHIWISRANLMVHYPGSRIEEDIKNHHIEYEKIHPFIDGNGRTGRMFLNWQRRMVGLSTLIIYENKKWEYYDWFKN